MSLEDVFCLNQVAQSRDPESPEAILYANMQVWALLEEGAKLPGDIALTNRAIAKATVNLLDAETGGAIEALTKLAPSSALRPDYMKTLVRPAE